MNLRQLTSNDSAWVHTLIKPIYTSELPEESVKQSLKDTDFGLSVGDPAIPIYVRLKYYEIVPQQASLSPIPTGYCTQIIDLYPIVPATQPAKFLATVVIPTLAEGLYQMGRAYPEVVDRPVWAFLDKDLSAQLKIAFFPNAKVSNEYIWHETLKGAASAIAKWRPGGS